MRTNELQHRLRSRHSRQNWCASCAPTNYNGQRAETSSETGAVRSVRTNELQLQYLRPDTVFSTVRSVLTNELQQKKNIKEYVNRPVRSVRTNELQLSWTGVRRPLPRVRSMCTNELQQHGLARYRGSQGCAPCAPTNYNEHRESTTDTRAGVRSVRTNELQLQLHRHQECHLGGAPRAHQRITTGSSFQSYSDERWCALCAPMNYNGYTKDGGRLVIGALRVHQRITTDVRIYGEHITHLVRFARTNKLQRYLNFISRLQNGVLCAHQRITTPFPPKFGLYGFWVRIRRTHELQLLWPSILRKKGALHAHP